MIGMEYREMFELSDFLLGIAQQLADVDASDAEEVGDLLFGERGTGGISSQLEDKAKQLRDEAGRGQAYALEVARAGPLIPPDPEP